MMITTRGIYAVTTMIDLASRMYSGTKTNCSSAKSIANLNNLLEGVDICFDKESKYADVSNAHSFLDIDNVNSNAVSEKDSQIVHLSEPIIENKVEKIKPVKAADIAEIQAIPLAYLEQILSRLRNAGLIKSTRGPGGGYILAKLPKDITLLDILNAVEENIRFQRCNICKQNPHQQANVCNTHHIWKKLTKHIESFFDGIDLESVLQK